jgi:GntR family transcriptional regulator
MDKMADLKSQKTKKEHPFKRLQKDLAVLIGKIKPGGKLPSEPELATRLGVSRATLREAMRAFEEQGLIRRRQGVGTFVVRHPQILDTGMEVLESIESIAARIGLQVSMGMLNIEHLVADSEKAQQLHVSMGTRLVQLSRVINAEERPVAFLIDLLPEAILPGNGLKEGFTGSVLDWLLKHGSPQLDHSKTEIQAVAASSEIARALQIQRGDVLLKLSANLYTAGGELVDHSSSFFLPGYFRFHVVRRVKGAK